MINNGVNTYSCYPYRGRVRSTLQHDSEYFTLSFSLFLSLIFSPLTLSSTQQSYCSYSSNCTDAKMSGIVRIEFGNETDLQAALGTVGPLGVTIDGNSKAFRVR